ncbi:MAG TPA: hypothetical protein VJ927_04040, partial [Actinomycetota bacterium]|nr:hypothetical protein [Actinomycetota bacterium]
DLTSDGVAERRSETTSISEPRADGPTPHLLTGLEVAYGNEGTADKLSGRLSNVSGLTIDVGRAGLSDLPALDIKADRKVTITFIRNGDVVGTTTLSGGS